MYNILIYTPEGIKFDDHTYDSLDKAVKAGMNLLRPFTIVKIIHWGALEIEGGIEND